MHVYYLVDKDRRARLQAAGINDTSAYIPAILHLLGVTGYPIAPDRLDTLSERDVLLAVRTPLPPLPCTVISFAASQDPAAMDEKKIYAHLLVEEKALAVFSPICPEAAYEEILAYARLEDGTEVPAWTRSGKRYDFAFDLPASVWYSGDGFPNEESRKLFFIGIGRVPEQRPLPLSHDSTVPYNDELCWLLRNILMDAGIPMFHTLPPLEDGTVPDFALHFSGDDDHSSASLNLTAALNMESFGLPYHINAMPTNGNFVMDKALYEELKAHGCETALHTELTEQPYTAQTQAEQVALFEKVFGEPPLTNVNHCFVQDGPTAERLSWLEENHILGDNGYFGEVSPDPTDINAFNIAGYAFGTSFPRFTCADAAHGNRILGTVSIPVTYYEPRLDNHRYNNEPQLLWYLSDSAANGRIAQFFIHPHYLNPSYEYITSTFTALKRIQSFIQEKEYAVWYTTTNAITAYWHNRRASTLEEQRPGVWSLTAACPLSVLLPEGVTKVECDGKSLPVQSRVLCGKTRNLAPISAAGEYTLTFA